MEYGSRIISLKFHCNNMSIAVVEGLYDMIFEAFPNGDIILFPHIEEKTVFCGFCKIDRKGRGSPVR